MIPQVGDESLPLIGQSDAGPLGFLPQVSARQVRLEQRLAEGRAFVEAFRGLAKTAGLEIPSDPLEVRWRASAVRRTGLVIQLSWARLKTRLALGIETPLAHALVDRLLGYERPPEEGLLQVTPVEWGVTTFLAGRVLAQLRSFASPLGAWDLTIDRVGPDPLDVRGLGDLVSIRSSASVGNTRGSIWLWVPESLVVQWLASDPPECPELDVPAPLRQELTSWWRAEAGEILLRRGLGTLRAAGILPLGTTRLGGTAQNPSGAMELVLTPPVENTRYWFDVEPAPYSGGARVQFISSMQRRLTPREALAVNPPDETARTSSTDRVTPADVPVTLVVEFGRVNLSVAQLAMLKPGDVVELGRHSREPVELTSGGRLVARGELIQIDTELGVRVTNVFL